MRGRIVAEETFFEKRCASLAHFLSLRFSSIHHFDEFKIFCNTTLRCPCLATPLSTRSRWFGFRVLYVARIGHCRASPLREQRQESVTTLKARRVSAVYWPLSSQALISGGSLPPPGEPSPLLATYPGDWQSPSVQFPPT
jgi:hypothetical protein